MKYKIIGSDLDHTFLNSEGVGSEENHRAVRELRELGVEFVPVSGRSFEEMPAEIRESPYIRYYIGSDGASIYDKETKQEFSLAMPKNVGHMVLDRLYRYPMSFMLHGDLRSYVDAATHDASFYRANRYSESWVSYVLATNHPVENFREFAYGRNHIDLVCAFFAREEDLQECKTFFEQYPDVQVAQSHPCNLEVVWKNAGKGNALLKLADLLGIDRKATIAVGDSTNDLTMVRQAGLGLAMENAVEELKRVADAVICHNDQHSTQYILEHYIKK